MPEYTPKPIDTSDVVLPAELEKLLEYLARNVHEVWSQRRMAQGWRYGPTRDDELMTTPLLVPYDALSESEREYDRAVLQEILRSIMALGFRIERDAPG